MDSDGGMEAYDEEEQANFTDLRVNTLRLCGIAARERWRHRQLDEALKLTHKPPDWSDWRQVHLQARWLGLQIGSPLNKRSKDHPRSMLVPNRQIKLEPKISPS